MRLSSSRVTSLTHRPQQDFPLWDKAGTRPSLDLQFADRRDLVDATTGSNLVDFTRASSGTYVGSDGLIKTATTNEPRFDHDPVTGESLGLLVEESRTNLNINSQKHEGISSTNVTSPAPVNDQWIAPDGTQTAFQFPLGASNYLQGNYPITVGQTYSLSFFAKQGAGTKIASFSGITGSGDPDRDLPGTILYDWTTDTLNPNWKKIGYSNGWSRFYRVFTSTVGNGIVYRIDNPSQGVLFWGFQHEPGSFPTSYIPTTGSTVTRAADVASISGSNFSGWYRQDEGTFFADIVGFPIGSGQFPRIFEASDGTSNNIIRSQQYGANTVRNTIFSGGSITMAQDGGIIAAGISGKTAFGVAENNSAIVTNGGTPSVDNTVTMPSNLNQLGILGTTGGTTIANSTISRFTYWPQRLPNDTLQTITQ